MWPKRKITCLATHMIEAFAASHFVLAEEASWESLLVSLVFSTLTLIVVAWNAIVVGFT